MKQFYLLILFFPHSLIAQSSWIPTSCPESNSRYDDVFFLNDNIGWAADGGGAKVYKTINGGTTWNLQLENPSNYFRNIEFLNENIGFLGTLNGYFFKTIDGGTTWEEQELPNQPQAICGLDTVGNSTIYGCGAYFGSVPYIIKSLDRGVTWTYTNMSAYATGLVEVMFLTENVGFASGRSSQGGVILKTIDGGATWSTIYTSQSSGDYVWKLQQLASNPNIMFGSVSSVSPLPGKLIKSVDNGLNWTSKNVPDTNIQAVGFIDENHGWMGGHDSGFLETFDSGTTWTPTGLGNSLNRIFFLNNTTAFTSADKIYKLSPTLSNQVIDKQQSNQLQLTVSPNPVTDKLHFEIEFRGPDNLLLELYSMEGKLLQKLITDRTISATKKSYTLDFPYPKGSYILNFHTNADRQSIKIIK